MAVMAIVGPPMPSPLHQAFVSVLQRHLHCALKLARIAGIPIESSVENWSVVSAEFGDPGSLGRVYLADLALVATGPDGEAIEALILEPQLGRDAGKYFSWPIYLVGMHTRYRCPGWELVLSPYNGVLSWAEHKLFPRQPHFVPHVVGCADVKAVLDDETASADPAWAIVAAALHARGPLALAAAKVASRACLRFPAAERRCYVQLVLLGLPEPVMNQLEPFIPEELDDEISEYEREGAIYRRLVRKARESGLEEGLEEGRQEGQSHMLLRVLDKRRIALTEADRTRILGCTDLEQLDRWLDRAIEVDDAEALFAP